MRKSLLIPLFVLLTASLLLAACGTAATPTPVVQVQT